MEPSETKALKPTFSFKLQSRMAVQRAPLWLMKPTLPGRAMAAAKVAFKFAAGHHDAEAVRPDDAHAGLGGFRQHLAFEFHAGRADFLEAGGDDDGALDARRAAILDDAGHAGRAG